MTTIAESFRQPLPSLNQRVLPPTTANVMPNARPYRHVQPSAHSTAITDPPRAWELDHPSTLFDLVRHLIPHGNQQVPRPLRNHLPTIESSHVLCTEGDVVRAAVLYLLNPVNVALERLCPAGCRIDCITDGPHGTSSRADIVWRYRDTQSQTTSFAVLEFKNTYAIHWADFEPGMANLDPYAPVDQQPASMVANSYTAEDGTFLDGNAVVMAKQAQKYHNETGCTDVALFD
ncbi:MAG: hypothetical protein M1836_006073 [Candelina mexicana]|nr:MAG: hypothetical protein M1836_006073 [Candelina mexicana]